MNLHISLATQGKLRNLTPIGLGFFQGNKNWGGYL